MTSQMVLDHLYLVIISVFVTIAAGVPIGIFAYMFKRVRKIILWIVEVLQTIPAMAMMGIIMVFLGAGKPTVIVAMVLYSLLPVASNTYVGLSEIDPAIKEVASGMGMTRMYRLFHVEIPIAFPLIFTGIRIAAVTAVGIAVFACFVGGGGIGSVIYRGIRIQNMGLILGSTFALMSMAILLDLIMAFVEKRLYRRSK